MSGFEVGTRRATATRRPRRGGPPAALDQQAPDELDQQLLYGNDAMKDLVAQRQAAPTGPEVQQEQAGAKGGAPAAGAATQQGKDREEEGPDLDDVRGGALLHLGTTGQAVEDVQQMLSKAGQAVRQTGVMDEDTVDAVRRFQRGRTASTNGLVGPNTLSALEAAVELGDVGQQIYLRTLAYLGQSTKAGPAGGKNAAAWSVNNVLMLVLGRRIGSNPNYVPSLETELRKVGTMVEVSAARPGDLVITSDQSHIGIYIGNGRVLSNNGTEAVFDSETNLQFDGAYGGGTSRIYRVNH